MGFHSKERLLIFGVISYGFTEKVNFFRSQIVNILTRRGEGKRRREFKQE